MHCNSKFSLKKFICLKNIIISFIIANSNFSFAQKEIPKTKAIFISEEIIIDGVNNEKVWDDAFESSSIKRSYFLIFIFNNRLTSSAST